MEIISDEELKSLITKSSENTTTLDEPDNSDSETTEDEISSNENNLEKDLNTDLDFNQIPETSSYTEEDTNLSPMITDHNDMQLGLTVDDIKDLYDYISGRGDKPLYIDKFTSDTEGRLKDMVQIMTMMQLSQIPTLTAYHNQLQERLYSPENLYEMDLKTVSAAELNISKEISTILSSAMTTITQVNQFGTINNEYRRILDRMMMLPEDKLNDIKEVLFSQDEK